MPCDMKMTIFLSLSVIILRKHVSSFMQLEKSIERDYLLELLPHPCFIHLSRGSTPILFYDYMKLFINNKPHKQFGMFKTEGNTKSI